jgi:hypothetical protein
LKNQQDIGKSFSDILRNPDLQRLSAEISESIFDSFISDVFLKDLPIIKSIIGIGKTAISIKDKLFIKKIIHFLSDIGHIPYKKRKNMIDSIDVDEKYKVKVGEKLVYILDKCDDYIDARYIAKFFCAFLEKKISYDDFLKGSRIIQNIFIGDLEYFLNNDNVEFEKTTSTEEAPDEDIFALINAGICGFGYSQIRVEDQWDHKSTDRYIVEGGEVDIWITDIGAKLKQYLNEQLRPNRR